MENRLPQADSLAALQNVIGLAVLALKIVNCSTGPVHCTFQHAAELFSVLPDSLSAAILVFLSQPEINAPRGCAVILR